MTEGQTIGNGGRPLDVLYIVPWGWRSQGANGAGTHMRHVMAGLEAQGARLRRLERPLPRDGGAVGVDLVPWALARVSPPLVRRGVRDFAFASASRHLARTGQHMIDERRPDVIYERSAFLSMTGWLLTRRNRIPRVLEVNGLPPTLRQFGIHPGPLPVGDAFERANLRDADRIITTSTALKRDIVRYGAEPDRISVLHCGAPADWRDATGERDAVRSRLGLTDKLVCGFVGHALPWHGIELLFEAARDLSGTVGVAVLLVGECHPSLRLHRAARRIGVTDRVVFAGRVPHDELPAYVAAMDVCVIPRHGPANSPIKLFEYGVAGKPIVAAMTPGILAVWTPGVHGIGIRNGNVEDLKRAILRYAGDAALRRRHGRAWRRKVLAEHTWEHVCRRTHDVLREASGRE